MKNRYWTAGLERSGGQALSIMHTGSAHEVAPLIDFNKELLSFLGPSSSSTRY
jgi:hypothetical protein